MGTKSAWTPERRARQALLIRQTKPWKKSTGPRTLEGKAISSRNAYAGAAYHEALAKLALARGMIWLNYGGRGRPPKEGGTALTQAQERMNHQLASFDASFNNADGGAPT